MIIIRKAALNDSEIIAKYLFLAMEEIVFKIIGEVNPEKGREFLLNFVKIKNNQYSYQNCWVVEDDMKIVAAINLYNGAQLIELRQPVIDYVRSNINEHFEPEDETQAGEYYIDSLGVDPDQQGNGMGTKLLQFIIDEYVNKRKQTLGLLVDEENPHAKRLYLKLGFKSAGKKVLLGKHLEHLQIKSGSFSS